MLSLVTRLQHDARYTSLLLSAGARSRHRSTAGTRRRRPRSYRSISPAHTALSSKPAARRCCCRDGQTDGRTPDRYTDSARIVCKQGQQDKGRGAPVEEPLTQHDTAENNDRHIHVPNKVANNYGTGSVTSDEAPQRIACEPVTGKSNHDFI